VCLLALMTVAAQCSENEEAMADIIAQNIANTAIAMESTIFPETEEPTEEPEPIEEPEHTEVSLNDELNDVTDFNTGQVASNPGPGLDLSEIILSVDRESGLVTFRAITPDVEDGEAFLTANPYWGLIVAGDGDPEGTPPLPGLDIYGMGQWHVGCFAYTGAFQCELWIREGSEFVLGGEAFPGSFMDGAWTFTFPEGYPPPGHRLGVAVLDPFYSDILGLEDGVPKIEFGEFNLQY
jgi:hypothetical protein